MKYQQVTELPMHRSFK